MKRQLCYTWTSKAGMDIEAAIETYFCQQDQERSGAGAGAGYELEGSAELTT